MQEIDKFVPRYASRLVDLASYGSGGLDEALEHLLEVDAEVVVVKYVRDICALFAALDSFFDAFLVEVLEFAGLQGIRIVLAVGAAEEAGLL